MRAGVPQPWCCLPDARARPWQVRPVAWPRSPGTRRREGWCLCGHGSTGSSCWSRTASRARPSSSLGRRVQCRERTTKFGKASAALLLTLRTAAAGSSAAQAPGQLAHLPGSELPRKLREAAAAGPCARRRRRGLEERGRGGAALCHVTPPGLVTSPRVLASCGR